jgi:di/tricarboxylate transporter
MSKSHGSDDRASAMRTQYFFLLVAGIVGVIYGAIHPEERLLGFVAGGVFILVGGGLLFRSLMRKQRARGERPTGS